MSEKLKFTMRRLATLTPPEKGRMMVKDTEVPGLAIRVTASGTMTALIDRKHGGRHVRHRLGRWPDDFGTVTALRKVARKALLDFEGAVRTRQRARGEPTLRDLFEHWLADAKRRKRTWADDVRQFEKYLKPFHARRLSAITKADVAKWHSRMGEQHGPYQANRARALLSSLFSVADELGYEGVNPCIGVRRFREHERERFLQPAEMRPFFRAVKEEPPVWRDFWLLCLFSGARRGNVAAMAWKDIDLDQGIWYLPGQKTKAGLPLAIVLPPPAVAILRARYQEHDGRWAFPADTASGHVVDPRKSWLRVMERAGIKDLRPHDLRRSLGSWQALSGASLTVIGRTLGHKDVKSTSIYGRLTLDPVRESVGGAVAKMLEAGGENEEVP
jgi:integrase